MVINHVTQLHLRGDNDEASSRNGSDLKRASYCVRGELKDERQFASTAYQIDTRHSGRSRAIVFVLTHHFCIFASQVQDVMKASICVK